MVRKIIVRAVVFIAIMVSTAYIVNKISNLKVNTVLREMEEPQLPMVYCEFDGQMINRMFGYKQVMATGLMRDGIVPLDETGGITLCLEDENGFAKSYSYELRTIAGDSLIEDGELDVVEEKQGNKYFHVNFRMDMKQNQEYVLVFIIKDANGDLVRYYSRVELLDKQYTKEMLEYAATFHNTTFVKNIVGQEGNIVYNRLRTTADGNNNDLSHVSLESTYDMVSWAGMDPVVVTDIVPRITELDSGYAVVEMEYVVESMADGPNHYYSVDEYYTLAYDDYDQKIEILAFDRYMDSYFDTGYISKNRNSISLGITDIHNTQYMYAADSRKVAFVKHGQLWFYDYKTSSVTSIFRFSQANYKDARSLNSDVDINLAYLDDDGNIYFAVYGYMCRGEHEGKNGISLYYYDAEEAKLQEMFFVESDEPFEVMKQETGRFTYYDPSGYFYYLLNGAIYKVDLDNMTQNTMIYGLSSGKYLVSKDRKTVVYPDSDKNEETTSLIIHNFERGDEHIEKGDATDRYLAIGFIGNDLIYGIAHRNDIVQTANGQTVMPLYTLSIVSPDGVHKKDYSKPNTYVMSVDLQIDKLYLNRAVKSNQFFEECEPDSISFKAEIEDEMVVLNQVYDSTEYVIADLVFPASMYLSEEVQIALTKAKPSENYTELSVKSETTNDAFYVFSNSGYMGEFPSAGDAILAAREESSGLVVDEDGNTIYRCVEATRYNTVASEIPKTTCESIDQSLLTCAYMCIRYAGYSVEYEDIMACDTWEQAFREYTYGVGINISGVTLSTALYFLDRDVPFAACIDDGRFVLVISYNSTHVRYYDPVEGGEVKVTRKKFEESLSMQSNTIYTYNSQ